MMSSSSSDMGPNDAEYDTPDLALRSLLGHVGMTGMANTLTATMLNDNRATRYFRRHNDGCLDWVIPINNNVNPGQLVRNISVEILFDGNGDPTNRVVDNSTTCPEFVLLQYHPPHYNLLENDWKGIKTLLNQIKTGNNIRLSTLQSECAKYQSSVAGFKHRCHWHARKVIRLCKVTHTNIHQMTELLRLNKGLVLYNDGMVDSSRGFIYFAECDTGQQYNNICKEHYFWPKKNSRDQNNPESPSSSVASVADAERLLQALETHCSTIIKAATDKKHALIHQIQRTIGLTEEMLSLSTKTTELLAKGIYELNNLDMTTKSINAAVTGINSIAAIASLCPPTAVVGGVTVLLCSGAKGIINYAASSIFTQSMEEIMGSFLKEYAALNTQFNESLIITSRLQTSYQLNSLESSNLEWTYKQIQFESMLNENLRTWAAWMGAAGINMFTNAALNAPATIASTTDTVAVIESSLRQVVLGNPETINHTGTLMRATFQHIFRVGDSLSSVLAGGGSLSDIIRFVMTDSSANSQIFREMRRMYEGMMSRVIISPGNSLLRRGLLPAAPISTPAPTSTSTTAPSSTSAPSSAPAIPVETPIPPTPQTMPQVEPIRKGVSPHDPDWFNNPNVQPQAQGNCGGPRRPRPPASTPLPSDRVPPTPPVESTAASTMTASTAESATTVGAEASTGANAASSVGPGAVDASAAAGGVEASTVGADAAAAANGTPASSATSEAVKDSLQSTSSAKELFAKSMRVVGAIVTMLLVVKDIHQTITNWNEEHAIVSHLKDVLQYFMDNIGCLNQTKAALNLELKILNPTGEHVAFVRPNAADVRGSVRNQACPRLENNGRGTRVQLENNGRGTRVQLENNGRGTRVQLENNGRGSREQLASRK